MQPDREGPLHVEIVSVGRDLLKGRVRDANAPFLAAHFSERGGLIHRITVVDDVERAIASAVREALERQPHLVITIGGLGPANDDRTVSAVAEAVQHPLKESTRARQLVEEAYRRLHAARVIDSAAMNAERERTCRLPVGAEPLANPIGVAPGVLIRLSGGAAVLCLPGAPDEMRAVFEEAREAIKDLEPRRHRAVREVEAPTSDEAALQPLIDRLAAEYPMVAVTSRPGYRKDLRVKLSLEASSVDPDEAEAAVDGAVRRLLALAAGVR